MGHEDSNISARTYKLLRLLATASHFIVFVCSAIVTGLVPWLLHKYTAQNTQVIYHEVIVREQPQVDYIGNCSPSSGYYNTRTLRHWHCPHCAQILPWTFTASEFNLFLSVAHGIHF